MSTLRFPIVDLQKQFQRLKSELEPALLNAASNAAYIQGPEVKEFSQKLAEFLNVGFVIPCGNGTDALQIAYMALGLKAGDEIIVPAFNYVAAAEAACLLGIWPVFADVEPDGFSVDIQKVEGAITSRTKAIVAVHLFGQACDMERLTAIASAHGLFLIEDNAQAIGAEMIAGTHAGKKLGSIGHIGTTSFFPSKNLGCMGDGGAITTNDEQLAIRCRQIANHGQLSKYQYERIGINSRLDTLQAALLLVKLKHLPDFTRRRQQVAQAYDQHFAGNEGLLVTPARLPWSSHVFHQYTIKLQHAADRNRLQTQLLEKGIQTMIYYPTSLHVQAAYRFLSYEQDQFPVSNDLSERVLSLPMHTELSADEVAEIAESVLSILR